jgi:capsular exopolysaccharide synthesis family protein
MGTNRYLPPDEFLELGEAGLAITHAQEYPSGAYRGYGTYGEEGEEDGLHLRDYLRQLRRHKWLILSLVLVVTTIVTLYAYQIKPWYTASAVLEIGNTNSVIVKSGEITLNGDSDSYMDINTKLLSFSNPKLFQRVAEELNLGKEPSVIASFQKKPMFSFLRPAAAEAAKVNPLEDEKQRLSLLGSYIYRGVTVEEIRNTRAIRISCTDENPEVAEKIANSVARLFRETSFDSQTEKFTNSVSWLDTSTRELRAQVQAAEEALDEYSRNNQIFSTGGGAGEGDKSQTITTSNLTQLNDQYLRAHTNRILKKSLFEQVQAGRLDQLPEAFSDPKITALQAQLDKLQSQVAELQVNYGPKNPKLMEVQSQIPVVTKQIETSRKALEAKLKADYERAVQDENSLNAALNQAKSAAQNENQASIKLNILKQDLETARSLYTDFLKNTNEAKTRVAEQNNNIKFIQEASVPGSPVGPNRMQLILAGFAISLAAGIGLALFLEYLDDTIKSLDDIERYVQLPMLGIIPKMSINGAARKFLKGNNGQPASAANGNGSQLGLELQQNGFQSGLMTTLDNHSMIGEAYRAVRTSLLLSTAGTPPKTILVTSGQSGEGKTTTAINTAISLTQLGAKVIIIDCDLRRPSVHKRLNISAAKGLTNYLATNCELSSVTQHLDIPNLDVIPSGPIPPNPAELLSSRKMKEMLKGLRSKYDHIILDSPPVVNVTDPIILSTIVEGTIFVIHGGKTRRDIVKRARQELQNVKSKIFGVILNNVDLHKDGYDYYSYYRYSSYERPENSEVETV